MCLNYHIKNAPKCPPGGYIFAENAGATIELEKVGEPATLFVEK